MLVLVLVLTYTNVIEVITKASSDIVTSVVLSKGAQDPVVVCIPGRTSIT